MHRKAPKAALPEAKGTCMFVSAEEMMAVSLWSSVPQGSEAKPSKVALTESELPEQAERENNGASVRMHIGCAQFPKAKKTSFPTLKIQKRKYKKTIVTGENLLKDEMEKLRTESKIIVKIEINTKESRDPQVRSGSPLL